VLGTARRKFSQIRWVGLAEMAKKGMAVDCLIISTSLNHPNASLPALAKWVRPGGALIGRIANAQHWRQLAQAFSGRSRGGYACSLRHVRALLEDIGFPQLEVRGVNAEPAETADGCDRFLQASAPLIEMLGVDAQKFAARCRATHYVVRGVRAVRPEAARTSARPQRANR